MLPRQFSLLDRIIIEAEAGLSTLFSRLQPQRANPAQSEPEPTLTTQEQKHSAGLMRVNHTGEVCAQALYRGQMLVAQNKETKTMLEKACQEEVDHLAWTQQRLQQLHSHRSLLNIFWYTNSFLIGVVAGLAGDRWSLGFIEETERQVGEHLEGHLGKLPEADNKSRVIVKQMHQDELQHGESAVQAGANELPQICKRIMQLHARIMTQVAYWV